MCGQFTLDIEENEKLAQIYMESQRNSPEEIINSGVILPSQTVPVIARYKTAKAQAIAMKWGYPKWNGKGLIINARSENVHKNMFKGDFAYRRCVIASSGFFEWDSDKNKFHFKLEDNSPMYMAGIFSVNDSKLVFAILTTSANEIVAQAHDRMPVILSKANASKWLTNDIRFAKILFEQKNIKLHKENYA